jgi:hypothetical protein
MSDTRSDEEIDRCAAHLYAIQADVDGPVWKSLWEALPEGQRDGWRRLARAIPGVIHREDATSGGWPTSPQADTIRELRKQYKKYDNFSEQSLIGTTRPYGEMVVIFSWVKPQVSATPISRRFLIHPDGHYEDLHKEKVPDSYIKKEG